MPLVVVLLYELVIHVFQGVLFMAVSKSRKKVRAKQRVYLRCRLCRVTSGLSVKGYCANCTTILKYGKHLESNGLLNND